MRGWWSLAMTASILYTASYGDAADFCGAVRSVIRGHALNDKTLTCKDCASEFVFSVRDQQFYAEKGFENEPQRCRPCRTQRKTKRSVSASSREMHDAICAGCNAATTVPFKPRGDRPVYCRDCFTALAPAAATSY